MRNLFLFCLLGGSLTALSQPSLSYPQLLESTREIQLSDSLVFHTLRGDLAPVDSFTVKRWFSQILPPNANNKFKNRNFSLAGKITLNNNFDLLVLREEKSRKDSSATQVTYLISMKKNGDYIASLKAAVGGTRKTTSYNITSCLYKDFKLVQDSRMTIDNKAYNDMAWYKINAGGRFVSYPKFN